jgi:hypothetical protein
MRAGNGGVATRPTRNFAAAGIRLERAFVLELMVVIILIIELLALFRGIR